MKSVDQAENVLSPNVSRNILALTGFIETPFYLIDGEIVSSRAIDVKTAWEKHFPVVNVAYSYKTNSIPAVTSLIRQSGLSAEVVSGTELAWAMQDGYSGFEIFFNGPVKSVNELKMAIDAGVTIQLDSLDEADRLLSVVGTRKPGRITCRLAVQPASRFGLLPDELPLLIDKLGASSLSLSGIHFHLGSNIVHPDAYSLAIKQFLPIIQWITETSTHEILLDIGGGFASKSVGRNVQVPADEEYAASAAKALLSGGIDLERLRLVVEPGRAIVESAGWLITRVVAIKHRDDRRIVIVDAGGNHLRSARNWHHTVSHVSPNVSPIGTNLTADPGKHSYVFGAQCFENDLLTECKLPNDLRSGDVIAFDEAGGYDICTASAWTRPIPPVVIDQLDGTSVARSMYFDPRAAHTGTLHFSANNWEQTKTSQNRSASETGGEVIRLIRMMRPDVAPELVQLSMALDRFLTRRKRKRRLTKAWEIPAEGSIGKLVRDFLGTIDAEKDGGRSAASSSGSPSQPGSSWLESKELKEVLKSILHDELSSNKGGSQ